MTRLLATLLILLCATPSFASDDDLAQRIKDNTVYFRIGHEVCVAVFASENRFTRDSVTLSCRVINPVDRIGIDLKSHFIKIYYPTEETK